MPPDISFYRTTEEPYGVFSNLCPHEVTVRSLPYRSVEDAYQSLKPRKADVRRWLALSPNPRLTAITAHALAPYDRATGWEAMRVPWMLECLRAKYRGHPELGALLLSTGAARLVETGGEPTEVNLRWGEVQGRGLNYLGRLLMLVRAEMGGEFYADAEMNQLCADGRLRLEAWYLEVHPQGSASPR